MNLRLGFCIAFSLLLHGTALFFLQYSWSSHPIPTGSSPLSLQFKEDALRESFATLSLGKEKNTETSTQPLIEQATGPFLQEEEQALSHQEFSPLEQPFQDLLAWNAEVPLLHPTMPQNLSPVSLTLPTFALPPSLPSPLHSHPEPPLIQQKELSPPEFPPIDLQCEEQVYFSVTPSEMSSKKLAFSFSPPKMPSFPTLTELNAAAYSDWFDLELVCIPKEDQSGYLFAITLLPYPDLPSPNIRQHYLFLIDRSNSIQKDRLLATKSAVRSALNELSPNDTFNLFAFDSKVEKLFPASKPVTAASLSAAKDFLDKLTLGSFFSPPDLYYPLSLTLPYRDKEDEFYTVILLTDGEALQKKHALHAILQNWTQQNQGKVSLFSLCMNSDPQLHALNVASTFNKGWLSSSPTKRGIKRKLLKLMKSIQTPLAKNISCKAISHRPKGKVELFPPAKQTPHLYLDQPFVLLGSTDTLDQFILFIQGKVNNQWLHIKKTVSFLNARQGNLSLKKEWAISNAHQCYEHYFHDRNPEHLLQAKEFLSSFDILPLSP